MLELGTAADCTAGPGHPGPGPALMTAVQRCCQHSAESPASSCPPRPSTTTPPPAPSRTSWSTPPPAGSVLVAEDDEPAAPRDRRRPGGGGRHGLPLPGRRHHPRRPVAAPAGGTRRHHAVPRRPRAGTSPPSPTRTAPRPAGPGTAGFLDDGRPVRRRLLRHQPREAQLMDPSSGCCWRPAGRRWSGRVAPGSWRGGRVGVFVGANAQSYSSPARGHPRGRRRARLTGPPGQRGGQPYLPTSSA
ncbi:hypothetical protein LT493_00495 [Streptomyces tricolor]|nr:hypothetical protein [Streptomyces tricolor]